MTKFLVVGDNDTTSGATRVYNAMKLISDVDLYIHAGDASYASRATTWVSKHKAVWSADDLKKWRITRGNHDTNSSETKQTQLDMENYLTRYKRLTYKEPDDAKYLNNIRRNNWLEFEIVNNVAFINMDTEDLDVEFLRDQYNWVKDVVKPAILAGKQAGIIDWVIVACHKPFFTLKSSHSPYTAVRFIYKDLFREMEVDVVVHGHNHNTQLWLPMVPNDSQANGEGRQLFTYLPDGKTFDFDKPHGQLYIISGHGAHEWNPINDSGSGVQNVMHYRDSGKFGFTQLEFSPRDVNNKTTLTVTSLDESSTNHYSYQAVKGAGVAPEPCTENQCRDPTTLQCRAIGENEQKNPTTGLCEAKPVEPCPAGQCNDPITGQCRDIGENEIRDPNTGICVKVAEPPKETKEYDLFIKDNKTGETTKILTKNSEAPEDKRNTYGILIDQKPNGPEQKLLDTVSVDVTTVVIPVEPKLLTPIRVETSVKSDPDKLPEMAIDKNMSTRCSFEGKGETYTLHFAKVADFKILKLECYHNHKTYFWSVGGKEFQTISGRPENALVEYDISDLNLRDNKLVITGNGNDSTDYNSFREIEVWGVEVDSPPPPPCSTGQCRDRTTEQCRTIGANEIVDNEGYCAPKPDPERVNAKFPELIKKARVGETVLLDGSQSTGPITEYTITQTRGTPAVTLNDVQTPKFSKTFTMPDTNDILLFELEVKDAVGNSDKDTISVSKELGGGGEEVLWDSNVHLKVEQETKVTNTFGSQEINGKGIWMAASGSPRCIIRPNGEFDLEAGAGHGRIYIQCQNYNARLEGEVKIDDSFSVVRNTTWRLRCRHNEPQPCENKFGGFGATHEMEEQLAEYSTESCHNNHENTIKKPLAKKVQRGQWIKFKFSVADNLEKTQVLFRTEYDYGDGNGFVTVLSGKHSSPKDYYMRESDFLVKRSYAWLRMNNEATGRVTYRNVKIVKIAAGSLGSGAGITRLTAGSDTEIDTGITPSKEDLERAKKAKTAATKTKSKPKPTKKTKTKTKTKKSKS